MTGTTSAPPSARPTAPTPSRSSTLAFPTAWRSIVAAAARWEPPRTRLVVVVPHPDDEVLGSGGLIATQRRRGLTVVVVAVTDGEAAYPDEQGHELAAVRRSEQHDALSVLGVEPRHVYRCAIPDGQVPARPAAIWAALDHIVVAGDLLVGPSIIDHHSDHVACGEVTAAFGRAHGITTLGSLFWAYHRTDPLDTGPLEMRRLDLGAHVVEQRSAALAAHQSQFRRGDGVLNADLVDHLRAPHELFVEVCP